MRKLILPIAAMALSCTFNADAKQTAFKQSNADFETRLCYAAATKGMKAVEKMVNRSGLSYSRIKTGLKCNGQSLAVFAHKYSKSKSKAEAKTVQLVAENGNLESKVCIEALMNGVDAAVDKYRVNADYITCNGLKLPRFVERNKNKALAFTQ